MKIDLWKVLILVGFVFLIRWIVLSKKKKYEKPDAQSEEEINMKSQTASESASDRGQKTAGKKAGGKNRMLSLNCVQCGASLELDPERLLAYCPYCGNKLLIDVEQLGALLTEREKTKREEERTRQEKERTEQIRYRREIEVEKARIENDAIIKLEKQRIDDERRRKMWEDLYVVFGIFILLILFFIIPKLIFNK